MTRRESELMQPESRESKLKLTKVGRDPGVTSRMMAAVRNKNTRPEVALRSALHARGLRYRVHPKHVPGHPDLVWHGLRVAIFVDGDFWHGNAWRIRGLSDPSLQFPTNTEWWMAKMRRNEARDAEVNGQLAEEGWAVIRIWESDILANVDAAAERVMAALRLARQR